MSQESPSVPPSPQTPKGLSGTSGTTTSGLASVSLVLGVLSVAIAVTLTQIPAIICGALALKRIRDSRGQLTGRGLAIGGIVTGVIGIMLVFMLVLASVIMLPALARARESARRASCANNLKQMGLVFKMFSNEARGQFYPQLSPNAGQLMCSGKEIYPEYLTDPIILVCPSNPTAHTPALMERIKSDPLSLINDDSYVYLGYVITSDDEMESFAKIYKERVAQGLPFNEDLKAPPGRGSMGTDTFYRLREGVEREFIADSRNPATTARMQSEIPVMWDKVSEGRKGLSFNHLPGGANVLFMDGHVEFVRYPSKWPLTKRMAKIIAELDALKP